MGSDVERESYEGRVSIFAIVKTAILACTVFWAVGCWD